MPTTLDLPDELKDLLKDGFHDGEGEEVDANPTLIKQREIKAAAEAKKARITQQDCAA